MSGPDLLTGSGQRIDPFLVELAARRLDCRPGELIKWRMEGGLLVVIAPDGRKFKFTLDEVRAMSSDPSERDRQALDPSPRPKSAAAVKRPAKPR